MPKELIIALIIFIAAIILWLVYKHNFKKITVQTVNLITGAPKTGKDLICSDLAPRTYKKKHFVWWFKSKILKAELEEPLFYCNTVFSFRNWRNRDNLADSKRKPHRLDKNIRWCDTSILKRAKRVPYGSVIYISEASLTSDQQEYMDRVLNCEQSLFNKLFGHETKGGTLFYNTQNTFDLHYAIKRCTSSYLWIQKSRNFFFFRVLYVRELINSDSISGSENNFNEDVDFTTRKYIVWRHCYKRYDRYFYSYLTDDLPISDIRYDYKQKEREIVTFSDLYRDSTSGLSEEEVRKRDNARTNAKALELYRSKRLFRKEDK